MQSLRVSSSLATRPSRELLAKFNTSADQATTTLSGIHPRRMMKTHSPEPYARNAFKAGWMSKRATVIGLIASLALVGGGIALSVATASSMGIMLIIPGLLSVILVSVFAAIGVEPQARRRAK
jgi:hypothetical protein